jgi:hypothetical protein
MTTTDDKFIATGPGFIGLSTDLNANQTPKFSYGGLMVGHTIGMFGSSGPLGGIHQKNNSTWRAGVEGVSIDNAGVVGVSLRAAGVFGQ